MTSAGAPAAACARVRSAAGRALRAAQTNAVQGTAAHGTGAIATGQAPDATESAAQAAVGFIEQLHQGLDTVAEQAGANGPKPACQAGCAHCCHLRVEATDPEVLHIAQQFAHVLRQRLAQQQTDVGIELVHIAHGVRTQAVLGHAGVVAQAGAAVVSGSGGDLCQTVAHGVLLGESGVNMR